MLLGEFLGNFSIWAEVCIPHGTQAYPIGKVSRALVLIAGPAVCHLCLPDNHNITDSCMCLTEFGKAIGKGQSQEAGPTF
jgi:hypothetical protein